MPPSSAALWSSRILKALVVLFLAFDGAAKVLQAAPVMLASTQLGIPPPMIQPLGCTILLCTLLYAVPLTSILGALLLTGFLGGAIAIQLRAGNPVFESIVFPALMAALVWFSLWLTDRRVRALLPATAAS